ncbi:MAG: hypothetical protein AB1351_05160 [Thermoproteota archaeon]
MNTHCDFTFAHYEEVLDYAKKNYRIGKIRDYPILKAENRFILLRHDVDISLHHALKMAEIENHHGLPATYFILLHTPFYNAFSAESVKVIKKISELGHEIGLHYDTNFFSFDDPDSIIRELHTEADILSSITGDKITSIAQHNVTTTPVIEAEIDRQFIDTKVLAREGVVYISDSVQNWRKGCMCNHVGKIDKLQVLTHPIWWSETARFRDQILDEFRHTSLHRLDRELDMLRQLHIRYIDDLKNGKIK